MQLIIVESPTKSKTLRRFLGEDYQIAATMGHVRNLPQKELGVDIEKDFRPTYVLIPKRKKTVQIIKELAGRASEIILATDMDREGEAIAWHIVKTLGLDEIKSPKSKVKSYGRIVFHEITREAIEEALKNPRDIDMRLVCAQEARRILDRLVGYELSPFLWRKVAKGLSAGRVQSPTVRLIVEREREIEKFVPQEYWGIEALLRQIPNSKSQTEFTARLYKIDDKVLDKLAIKSEKEAKEILKDLEGRSYIVKNIQKKEKKLSPAPPFITSTLQQEANKRLGFTSKQTMRIAQSLYEGIDIGEKGPTGLISYMRTDSVFLSDRFLKDAQKFISQNFGKNYALEAPRKFKAKSRLAQEAHEAIRPTDPGRSPEEIKKFLDGFQYRLYDLIWRRALASQMTDAQILSTTVDIDARSKIQDTSKYVFRASGSIIKFDGFLKVWPTETREALLPPLRINEKLKLVKIEPLQHFTQPPARFSEAMLVKTLEELGIGRPSTYAPIISTIQERGYVEKEKGRFSPTEVGALVNDLLVRHFSNIVDYQFTARMEEELDQIAQGKINREEVLGRFWQPFKENLRVKEKEVSKNQFEEETAEICEKCGRPMVIKMGRFGKFLACSGFPKCKNTKPLPQASTGISCPKCGQGEIVEKKTKKGKTFYGCSRWPECDFALWQKPTGEFCPKCKSLLVEAGKKIKCSNKDCDYVRSDLP